MKLGQAARTVKGENWYVRQYEEYLHHRNVEAERVMIMEIMKRPERIRGWSWSASSTGRCVRERQFTYLGFPQRRPDAKSMNIFANGDYMHIRHQAFGLVAGFITEVEIPVSVPELNLLGTADGRLSNGRGLELKSINTRGFSEITTFGAKRDHVMQVHAYMLADESVDAYHVVYEDKNTQNIKEILVPRDEKIIKSVREELEQLNEASNKRMLLPMLQECRNGQGAFRWCSFREICEEAEWPSASKPAIRRTSSSDAS